MHLTFLGAAQNVTGSCYLLESEGRSVVIDCGTFQERDFQHRNWEDFPIRPAKVGAVLLTHAHLDHCGLLPRLSAKGFHGPIFATAATASIAAIVLRDSARILEEDLRQKQERHAREGRDSPHPYEPLYTTDDAENAIALFRPVPFAKPVQILPGIHATYIESGHILGAASIRVDVREGERTRTVLFSGDIGRDHMPLIRDPAQPAGADFVVVESTYGDRLHPDSQDIEGQLASVVNATHKAGGNLVIPSFAVERSQDLLYHFSRLVHAKRIPHTLVFLDSPMAVRVTDVFKKHPDLMDAETLELLERGQHPCDFPGLQMARTRDQSKAINQIRGTVCVIAGSGMCTGGRIKHHLRSNLPREESTILFVGYQAEGTLGRQILGRPEGVRLFGGWVPVKARIEQLQGFSGHADRDELRQWVRQLDPAPKEVFVTHGGKRVSAEFAAGLAKDFGLKAHAPAYQERVEL
jgi:metallo-beta-lactamase family protein